MPWKVYRDASTGEYVTAAYAAEHPDTTVSETVDPREHPSRVVAQYAVHEDDDSDPEPAA
jgi:hypothetical protein